MIYWIEHEHMNIEFCLQKHRKAHAVQFIYIPYNNILLLDLSSCGDEFFFISAFASGE